MLLGFAEETQFPFAPINRRCALVYEMLHGGDLYRRRGRKHVEKNIEATELVVHRTHESGMKFTISIHFNTKWVAIAKAQCMMLCMMFCMLCLAMPARLRDEKPYQWQDRLRTATEAQLFVWLYFGISWTRGDSALQVCRGLAHLHKHRPKIFHRTLIAQRIRCWLTHVLLQTLQSHL